MKIHRQRVDRTIVAIRAENAVYRRTLEQVLSMAIDLELDKADGVLAYRLIELLGEVLKRKSKQGPR